MKSWLFEIGARGGLFLLAIGLSACGGAFVRGGSRVGSLAVRDVDWNPDEADVGAVEAVIDVGERTVVFGSHGAVTLVRGRITATDARIAKWVPGSAGVLPAASGAGSWIVAVSADHTLYRVDEAGALVSATEEYGLSRQRLDGFDAVGEGSSVFFLTTGKLRKLALWDHGAVTFLPDKLFGAAAGGGGRVVWSKGLGVRTLDARSGVGGEVPFERGALGLAVDARGRIYASDTRGIYAEDERGQLVVRYERSSPETAIWAMVVSGERLWFDDGGDLGVLEGDRAAVTTGLGGPRYPLFQASPSGDVWVIDPDGHAHRYAVDSVTPGR